MNTRLYLIRHGESEWNRFSRYAGKQDVALSERGRLQAQRLGQRLVSEGIVTLYASPLQRARETAEIIARYLERPVVVEPGLAEIDHGLWEGLTTSQVIAEYPSHYDAWRYKPHTVVMPQGESLEDVASRTMQAAQKILDRTGPHGGKVAICAHDAVLRVLLLKSLDLGLEHFWKWNFENASLSVLEVVSSPKGETLRVARLNDTAHLEGLHSEYAHQAL